MTRLALAPPIESMVMEAPGESTPERAVILLGAIACRTRSRECSLLGRELVPVLIIALCTHGYEDKSMVMDIRGEVALSRGVAGGGVKHACRRWQHVVSHS